MESQEETQTDAMKNGTRHHEEKIARSAGTVAIGTFTSRILGFIRDMILARIFGASLFSDAFYVAFRIPNLLRELFAEGSMSAAFVPVFTETLSKRGEKAAKELAQATFSMLFLLLAGIVMLGIVFSPLIIRFIAPGFIDDPVKFSLTASLTRMMFPFLLFISLAAVSMGILNSLHIFAIPAFSSAAYNTVNIITILSLSTLFQEPVYAAAIGVTLGGLAQFLIHLPSLYKKGFVLVSMSPPTLPLHPGIKQMGRLILPTLLGLSVTQINLLVNTLLASYLPVGSVSYLYYGMRLIHFPLGIFAVALSTALLPTLSAQVARDDFSGLRQSFSFSLRLVFFITFPALFGLILFRYPIVHILFEHGEFDQIATRGTADAILFYALGLWAFAGIRIVVPVFYALQDTRTPVKIGIITMAINLILNLFLMGPLKHRGLALATSVSAGFNFIALLFFLRQKIGQMNGRHILSSHIKVIIASLIMIIPAYILSKQLIWHTSGNWGLKTIILTTVIITSLVGYMIIQSILKSEEVRFINKLVREKRRT
ncbi:MAG: murein biosynthesis integral membrane protein MurJ [Nitrospiria bacterium]